MVLERGSPGNLYAPLIRGGTRPGESTADGRQTSRCPMLPPVRYRNEGKIDSPPSKKIVTKRSCSGPATKEKKQ